MYMLQRRACGIHFHMYFQRFEGLIHEGDELKEVNGVSLEHRNPKEILPLLVSLNTHVWSRCLLRCLLIGCFCFLLSSCAQLFLSSFQCWQCFIIFLSSTNLMKKTPTKRQSVCQYISTSLPCLWNSFKNL